MTRLIRAFRAMVAEMIAPLEYSAVVRYRVVSMSGDRPNLQVVRKGKWPDVLPCDVWAGLPGMKAVFTPGALVAVTFLENDPQLPALTHFQPPGAPGFLPIRLTLGADDGPAPAAARVGDVVQGALAPGSPITGTITIGGTPSPFVGTFASPLVFIGTIQTGSTKVGIGG